MSSDLRSPESISVALTRVGAREADAAEFAGAFPILDEAQLATLRPDLGLRKK